MKYFKIKARIDEFQGMIVRAETAEEASEIVKNSYRAVNIYRAEAVAETSAKEVKYQPASGYANRRGWTDRDPFEIIGKRGSKTFLIRSMKAEQTNKKDMNFIPGGFSAHCVNNYSQEWDITPDPDGHLVEVRLSKKVYNRGMRSEMRLLVSGNTEYVVSDTPSKFYDFNF